MYFQNYKVPKKWLDIGLKSPVSADPLSGKVVKMPKHGCNPNDTTMTISNDHFERK